MRTVITAAVILLAVVALGAGMEVTRAEFDNMDARVTTLEKALATFAYEDEVAKLADRVAGDEDKIERLVLKTDFDKVEARTTFLENELADFEKAMLGFTRVPGKNAPKEQEQTTQPQPTMPQPTVPQPMVPPPIMPPSPY